MRHVTVLLILILFSSPIFALDILKDPAKKELKKMVQTDVTLDKTTVTGFKLRLDLVTLQRLINAQGNVSLKDTKWNEIWLEDFVITTAEDKTRLAIGATIRYRTYTKNIFRPSRKWRTASYEFRVKGSVAIGIEKDSLTLSDFRVDLADLKHFPGWAENAFKSYMNGKINTSISLPFKLAQLTSDDLTLDSILSEGNTMVGTFSLAKEKQFPIDKLSKMIKGVTADAQLGVDFAPMLLQASVDLYDDDYGRGEKSHGLFLKFNSVSGVTQGMEIQFQQEGEKVWRTEKWYVDKGKVSFRMGQHRTTKYEGTIFGNTASALGMRNLPGGQKIKWRARYNFASGTGPSKLGNKWTEGVMEVPDYGIKGSGSALEGNLSLSFSPEIKEFSVVEDPTRGRYLHLELARPTVAQNTDVLVWVSIKPDGDAKAVDVFARSEVGQRMRKIEAVTPDIAKYYALEETKNGFSRTIVTQHQNGFVERDGAVVPAIDIPDSGVTVSVQYTVLTKLPKRVAGGPAPVASAVVKKRIPVPANEVTAPKLKFGTVRNQGITFFVINAKGDATELEYYKSGGPANTKVVSVKRAYTVTVPATQLDPYQSWVVRARAKSDAGVRSPWSNAVVTNAMAKPEPKADAKAVNNSSSTTHGASTGTKLFTVTNKGTGQRKSGGTSPRLALANIHDNDVLTFAVVSGSCSYITVHGRTSRGSWRTLYKGAPKDLKTSDVLKGRRSEYTHLIFSANGSHERYDRKATTVDVYIAGKAAQQPAEAAPKKLFTAVNKGTGQRKYGGSSPGILLTDLQDNDVLSFSVVSGSCSYVTIHGRTSRGRWSTLYKGAPKDMKVSEILKGKRSSFTHLIFSANGAHERYDRKATEVAITKK